MGKKNWPPDQFFKADLNAILLAWEGYDDQQDDLYRVIYRSQGGKYPDRKPRGSRQRPAQGWSGAEINQWVKSHGGHVIEVDLSTLQ